MISIISFQNFPKNLNSNNSSEISVWMLITFKSHWKMVFMIVHKLNPIAYYDVWCNQSQSDQSHVSHLTLRPLMMHTICLSSIDCICDLRATVDSMSGQCRHIELWPRWAAVAVYPFLFRHSVRPRKRATFALQERDPPTVDRTVARCRYLATADHQKSTLFCFIVCLFFFFQFE